MKTEELLEVLSKLERKEIKKLQALLRGKYWQLHEDYKKFFLSLLKKTETAREKLCQQAKKKNRRNFQTKRRRLAEIVEEFIAQNCVQEDAILKELSIAQFYLAKQLIPLYTKKVDDIREEIEESPIGMTTEFYRFKLNELIASKERVDGDAKDAIVAMKQALEGFYATNHWWLKCELLNLERTRNQKADAPIQENYIIKLFRQVFKMLEEETAALQHYQYLKKEMGSADFNALSEDVQETILVHLMNYATAQIIKGSKAFAKDYISYVEDLANRDFFLENGRLAYSRYRNAISAYSIDEDISFLEIKAFMDKYEPLILHKEPPTVISKLIRAYATILKKPKKDVSSNSRFRIKVG